MPSLLMIVPSRGRAGNLDRLIEAWRTTSTGCADLVVALDDDDPRLYQYNAHRVAMVTVGSRQSWVSWTNEIAVAHAESYRFVGSMGDDHRPRTPGWDRLLCAALDELGSGVAWGDDLGPSPVLPSAVAMTSDVVAALGYMVPPALVHNGAELFWQRLADGLGRSRFLPEVVVEHLHYSLGKSSIDHTYLEGAGALPDDRLRLDAYLRDELPGELERLGKLLGPTGVPLASSDRGGVALSPARR